AIAERTLVAFGGAAPLHASRLAEKLGIARIIVPPDAGVGSAVGFLAAPAADLGEKVSLHALRRPGSRDQRRAPGQQARARRRRHLPDRLRARVHPPL